MSTFSPILSLVKTNTTVPGTLTSIFKDNGDGQNKLNTSNPESILKNINIDKLEELDVENIDLATLGLDESDLEEEEEEREGQEEDLDQTQQPSNKTESEETSSGSSASAKTEEVTESET